MRFAMNRSKLWDSIHVKPFHHAHKLGISRTTNKRKLKVPKYPKMDIRTGREFPFTNPQDDPHLFSRMWTEEEWMSAPHKGTAPAMKPVTTSKAAVQEALTTVTDDSVKRDHDTKR